MSRKVFAKVLGALLWAGGLLHCGSGSTGETPSPSPVSDGGTTVPPVSTACTDALATFRSCGGDIAGSWALTEVCDESPPDLFDGRCPEARAARTIRSTQVLKADGSKMTFLAGKITSTAYVSVPNACIPKVVANGKNATCAQVRSSVVAQTSGKCTETAASCDCTMQFEESTRDEPSSYTVAGTRLNIVENGNTDSLDYCVSGTRFVMRVGPPDNPRGGSLLLFTRM